ncbi:hypothetical protein DL98DRAFT_458552 [Cadophora sp. DSE1049]|nr:hypothetical protein DL98DRAFT_458552 [Cadophora sp. DSE1049]
MDENGGMMKKKNAREDLKNPEREVMARSQTQQPTRKSGRPRLDSPGFAVLSSDRRAQVRQAQKTYRLKKEASFESYKSRMIALEQRMKKLAEIFVEFYDRAGQLDLHLTHPEIFTHLRGMGDHLAPEIEEIGRNDTFTLGTVTSSVPVENVTKQCCKSNESHNDQLFTATSCQVSSSQQYGIDDFDMRPAVQDTQCRSYPVGGQLLPVLDGEDSQRSVERSDCLYPQHIDRPVGESIPFMYSFHETTFSRRIQRCSLEHAYRLFVDTRSDPTVTYRMFRLVPCIREKLKMLPYFQNLVHARVEDALEIPSLPFYCIGGAGTHYPHKDHSGNPAYPSNTRLPRRILGIFPGSGTSGEATSRKPQSHLKLFGFDGDWFDCQDVQGYLEDNGVILHQSSLFAKIHRAAFHQSTTDPEDGPIDRRHHSIQETMTTNDRCSSFGDEQVVADIRQLGRSKISSLLCTSPQYLDIECFLSVLLQGLVFLGRAPGFRRSDVAAAFKSALRVEHPE